MNRYPYLLASLPVLEMFGAPPMRSDELLELLVEHLSPRDKVRLQLHRITRAPKASRMINNEQDDYGALTTSEAKLLQPWRDYDAGVRGELARLRAHAIGIDEDVEWAYMDSAFYLEETHRIFALENHLEGEQDLHRMRWEMLTDWSNLYRDDLRDLYIYYIKITQLERMEKMRRKYAEINLKNIHTAVCDAMIAKINMV